MWYLWVGITLGILTYPINKGAVRKVYPMMNPNAPLLTEKQLQKRACITSTIIAVGWIIWVPLFIVFKIFVQPKMRSKNDVYEDAKIIEDSSTSTKADDTSEESQDT